MADRIPLIVNSGANQIQELPSGDTLVLSGELTAAQPTCLLTGVTAYNAEETNNDFPIAFAETTKNVGCTVMASGSAGTTASVGFTTITVPTAGNYLVSAAVSGRKTNNDQPNDMIVFYLAKNNTQSGIGTFPTNYSTWPRVNWGERTHAEFNVNFTLPLTLAASDKLSVAFNAIHPSPSQALISWGYFSLVKLN